MSCRLLAPAATWTRDTKTPGVGWRVAFSSHNRSLRLVFGGNDRRARYLMPQLLRCSTKTQSISGARLLPPSPSPLLRTRAVCNARTSAHRRRRRRRVQTSEHLAFADDTRLAAAAEYAQTRLLLPPRPRPSSPSSPRPPPPTRQDVRRPLRPRAARRTPRGRRRFSRILPTVAHFLQLHVFVVCVAKQFLCEKRLNVALFYSTISSSLSSCRHARLMQQIFASLTLF